jgi:hypothetical protein
MPVLRRAAEKGPRSRPGTTTHLTVRSSRDIGAPRRAGDPRFIQSPFQRERWLSFRNKSIGLEQPTVGLRTPGRSRANESRLCPRQIGSGKVRPPRW